MAACRKGKFRRQRGAECRRNADPASSDDGSAGRQSLFAGARAHSVVRSRKDIASAHHRPAESEQGGGDVFRAEPCDAHGHPARFFPQRDHQHAPHRSHGQASDQNRWGKFEKGHAIPGVRVSGHLEEDVRRYRRTCHAGAQGCRHCRAARGHFHMGGTGNEPETRQIGHTQAPLRSPVAFLLGRPPAVRQPASGLPERPASHSTAPRCGVRVEADRRLVQ